MLARFLQNHVLANLVFGLVLVLGILTYLLLLPRAKDPEINFNWVNVLTVYPGASAADVESQVTDILEEGVERVKDLKFVSSYSRDGLSNILLRFNSISERVFDRRMNELRAQIQIQQRQLPGEAEDPSIIEINSSNAFPTASIVVSSVTDDENLRFQAALLERDMERVAGVDRVDAVGLRDPQWRVKFDPDRLVAAGVLPSELADSLAQWFRDTAAGELGEGKQLWRLRVIGRQADPAYIEQLPLLGRADELRVGDLARVEQDRERATQLVSYQGRPAVLLSVFKQANSNTIETVEALQAFIEQRNRLADRTGVRLVLTDDQTVPTREAIDVMQRNAVLGLILVMLVTWVFLGSRIAFFTTVGIAFTLAGVFVVLQLIGSSLNTSVLLGVVIALGMLVDDAIVVVEGIQYRMTRGIEAVQASVESLREVFAPVTTSVLTTMAAFLPLMLLPGILGDFMSVIPMVVSIALAISLLEAYWMLPAHVIAMGPKLANTKPGSLAAARWRLNHGLRLYYSRFLIKALRRPKLSLMLVVVLIIGAAFAFNSPAVRVDFFAMGSFRLFYVNVQMPPGTRLQESLRVAREVEQRLAQELKPEETRSVVSYAGQMFTETEPLFGDHYAQVMVSLKPKTEALRTVEAVVEAVRPKLDGIVGPERVWLLPMKDGPPTGKPISVKVRGDDLEELSQASSALRAALAQIPGVSDISDDAAQGPMELVVSWDASALRDAGLSPALADRNLRLLADGEEVGSIQHLGKPWELRVQADKRDYDEIDQLLERSLVLPEARDRSIALGELAQVQREPGLGSIRHYDFRRTITLEAELDTLKMDVLSANAAIKQVWRERLQQQYPNVSLDFAGQLDDIEESINSIGLLFLFGLGLIYIILGTQFRSYAQPLMILMSVPLAFTGVVVGLLISGYPMSLFTLYGVVALAGIAVNSAIVLISAANQRLEQGMSLLHATVYAARRRVVPILITALTTIAGLFSLAAGIGGHSLLWGPVATVIVWGLGFSTVLTLIVIPILYRLSMGRAAAKMTTSRLTKSEY